MSRSFASTWIAPLPRLGRAMNRQMPHDGQMLVACRALLFGKLNDDGLRIVGQGGEIGVFGMGENLQQCRQRAGHRLG